MERADGVEARSDRQSLLEINHSSTSLYNPSYIPLSLHPLFHPFFHLLFIREPAKNIVLFNNQI
jgi:hypothetical protein